MRYYVVSIQYNKQAHAENRTAPKGFDDLNQAIREFHFQLAQDMNNPIIGWSICMVFDSDGYVKMSEKYIATEQEVEE